MLCGNNRLWSCSSKIGPFIMHMKRQSNALRATWRRASTNFRTWFSKPRAALVVKCFRILKALGGECFQNRFRFLVGMNEKRQAAECFIASIRVQSIVVERYFRNLQEPKQRVSSRICRDCTIYLLCNELAITRFHGVQLRGSYTCRGVFLSLIHI